MAQYEYKKKFGQHFLFNPQMHVKILNSASKALLEHAQLPGEEDNSKKTFENLNVIEIGPGAGHLSESILKNLEPKRLIMLEKDEDLKRILRKKFFANNNVSSSNESLTDDGGDSQSSLSSCYGKSSVKLIFEDALFVNYRQLILDEGIDKNKEKVSIIANLPYNISTKLLLIFFEIQCYFDLFSTITVLVQKEVAMRFSAKVGEKEYSKVAILAQLFFKKTVYHFEIGPKNFTPPPKVDSVLISFIAHEADSTLNSNFEGYKNQPEKEFFKDFLHFLNSAFSAPRKMLFNNLKNVANNDSNLLEEAFEKLQIKKNARANEIPPEIYVDLFNYFKK